MQRDRVPRISVGALAVIVAAVAMALLTFLMVRSKRPDVVSGTTPTIPGRTGFRAEGLVTGADGRPSPGTRVYALAESTGEPRAWIIRATTVADREGRFAFRSLPWLVKGREYTLVAHVPHRLLGRTDTRIYSNVGSYARRSEDLGLGIRMVRLGSYHGRVVDGNGRGISGASVRAIDITAGDQWFPTERMKPIVRTQDAVTDAGGNYTLTDIPTPSRLIVTASKSGYAQYPRPYEADPARVVMWTSGRVRGRLVDESGRGIGGVSILASGDPPYAGHGQDLAVTDTHGRYELDLYPTGNYRIAAMSGMNTWIAKGLRGVWVKQGKTVSVPDMVAGRTVPLRGRVLDASTGRPIAPDHQSVYVRPRSYCAAGVDRVQLGANGRYEQRVLPGETYDVVWQGLGMYERCEGSARTAVVPRDGADGIDLRVRKVRTATGCILDQAGRPVEGASVTIPLGTAMVAIGPSYGYGRTGPKGVFEFGVSPGLASMKGGSVLVQVYHEGRRLAASQLVDVRDLLGGRTRISLQPTTTLRVTVLGSEGRGVPAMTVFLSPDFRGMGQVETDSSGVAVLEVCPGVRYTLACENRHGFWQYSHGKELPAVGGSGWKGELVFRLDKSGYR